jgi:exopolyphosphatase / guanosine-5'-triphosphate,3'-diphosphate pyrophosphatase
MAPIRRAVIDIGTNSVKLLVADVARSSVVPVFEDSKQTRLGAGFYVSRQLQPESIAKTASAVAQFAGIARLQNAATIRVFATSAARDAINQRELLDAVQTASGLSIEVISGEQEASWVYDGVRSDPTLAGQRLMILDVGGGSTEFIVGDGERPEFSHSFAIGSVRLLEMLKPSNPPTADELKRCRETVVDFFLKNIQPVVEPVINKGTAVSLVGTGGAATILARMEYSLDKYRREEIDGSRISLDAVQRWMETLWAWPLHERERVVGLPKKRADVILTGMCIFETVLRVFGFSEFLPSTRGLRFAGVMQPTEPALTLTPLPEQ